MVEQALGTRLAYFLPDDPATVNASINTGSPLLTVSPRAKISKGIAALADDMAQLRKSASTQPSHEPQGANLAITAAAAVL
jgi:MinD-like ATPase involved in chromosome partitioning or flagellar assembly